MLADDFEPWSAKKTSILSRYTTSEKISITTVSTPGCELSPACVCVLSQHHWYALCISGPPDQNVEIFGLFPLSEYTYQKHAVHLCSIVSPSMVTQ